MTDAASSDTGRPDDGPRDASGEGDPGGYPPLSAYGLISDCHSAALVTCDGSIDWYCCPRLDGPSVFAALLDRERGGSFRIRPTGRYERGERSYVDKTLVLDTSFRTDTGVLRIRDCLPMRRGGARSPRNELIRLVECTEGEVEFEVLLALRFDYGSIPPWIRPSDDGRTFSAVGGSEGMVILGEGLEIADHHDLRGRWTLRAGERRVLGLAFREPELIDDGIGETPDDDELVGRVDETIEWWHRWCRRRDGEIDLDDGVLRSALTLKALTHAPTGAIAAAVTTSLPEIPGGDWNWDYRFSWIRDSWMTVRSLAEAGFVEEADGFRRFVQRSAASSEGELQLMYGIDGRHRTPEFELEELEGYRGARPVRVGNAAQSQLQLDMYGYLLELTWRWMQRGASPDPTYWRFLISVVDAACGCWRDPDNGIWELRGEPQHYVYSKVLCWVAVDRGLAIADELDDRDGIDRERWERTRAELRETIEEHGICPDRGCFVETLDSSDVDASALLIAELGFVEPDSPAAVATVEAVIAELDDGGLIRRFAHHDDSMTEGAFVACTFWLVERLVELGRRDEAAAYYERACAAANDLGLYAEEYDVREGEPVGNFPQALSHLAHIGAAAAMARDDGATDGSGRVATGA